jgi:hypothetical protein
MPRAWRVVADVWLDGTEPWHRANGVVAQKVIAGTIVHIRDGDDAHVARFGGWGNLRPATGHHGTSDGRGAVAAARPAPARAVRVHGDGGRVVALWEALPAG